MVFRSCRRARSKPPGGAKFAPTDIGYLHIDIAELRLAQGKLNMFLAIDRFSTFTYVEFRDDAAKMNGADFLRGVIKAFPYKIHTVLTDNGMAFHYPDLDSLKAPVMAFVCAFNFAKHLKALRWKTLYQTVVET